MEIVQNLFRTLMFFLDNIVYGLIPQIYKLFVYLSQLNLFSGEDNPLQELINRVYVLLGIFMLFKVSFSLLQYIVDPSAFRDSSKGMGKLVTNVLVALVLLVSVPYIFDFAAQLQNIIVQNNVIGQLILGSNMSDENGKITPDSVETMAKDVQFMMFGAFYSLNPAVTEGDGALFSGCNGTSGVFGSRDMARTEGCLTQLDTEIGGYEDASANDVDLYSFFKYVGETDRDGNKCNNNICDERDFSHFDKLLWWKSDGEYVINYLPFISTAAGIYVVFLLIVFCVDVAVRVIKLCFLQMIAPIAIVSYIDPKESIGNGKLNSWIKECASTYFSLFLRLAVVFLVIVLISVISSMVLASDSTLGQKVEDITGGDVVFNIWIYLFLIIGAFMFAKQVPKMIESIFGIKGSGELSLNPFKSIGNILTTPAIAAGGAAIGGALGAGAANTIAAVSNVKNNWGNNYSNFKNNLSTAKGVKGKLGVVGSAISPWTGIAAGVASGGLRGAKAGFTGKNMAKGASSAIAASNQARYKRDVSKEANYGWKDKVTDKVSGFAGIKNKDAGLGKMDKDIKTIKKQMSDLDMQESGVREQMSSYYKRFDREVLNNAIQAGSYEDYLKTQNINIPVSHPTTQSTSMPVSPSSFTSAADSSNMVPGYVDVDNRPSIVNLDGTPMFNQSAQNVELPKGVVDEKTFNEYKNLYNTVESINNERETLRQESSRLEDVSNARNINNKK